MNHFFQIHVTFFPRHCKTGIKTPLIFIRFYHQKPLQTAFTSTIAFSHERASHTKINPKNSGIFGQRHGGVDYWNSGSINHLSDYWDVNVDLREFPH